MDLLQLKIPGNAREITTKIDGFYPKNAFVSVLTIMKNYRL